MQTFTDLITEALSDPEGDRSSLTTRLPRLFTDEERRHLMEEDQKLQAEDAFATWQNGRGN